MATRGVAVFNPNRDAVVRQAALLVNAIGAAAAVAGAAPVTALPAKITSEALTTAQDAIYTLTITDTLIEAADIVLASVANGTNSQGAPTSVA